MCHVCVCMCECEILIVLTQALKISLHAEAPWFSRIHNACNTEELTDICILLYCILVYSCTCLKGLATVQECDIVTCHFIQICSHVCCLFFFFIHFSFSVNMLPFFLLVTNLLINCEDVSCPLTRAQITSWFF